MATTLDDLYQYYCRRKGCKANSCFSRYLIEEFERQGQKRVLETVDLSLNYVGRKGIIPVLDLVKNVKTIKKLNLSNNMLEHEELEHLVYCLALHPSVEEVVLANNCFHDASVKVILDLLELNGGITTFDVDGNEISAASVATIGEQLEKNRARRAERESDVSHPSSRRWSKAQIEGSIDELNSGGHIHFGTWWKNPQYFMRTSAGSQVRIVMDVEDAKEARQVGFFVFRSSGQYRVVELSEGVIAGESACDHSHCYLTMSVEENETYSVMPYTFYPSRSVGFRLTAEMCSDDALSSRGWITLEPVDPAVDWCLSTLDGEWTEESAGGSHLEHTWCRNHMIRVQYAGSVLTHRMAAPATLIVKLSKGVDPDVNDEKSIGFHVLTPDTEEALLPPIFCKDECVKCFCPHERTTTISASFAVSCTALQLFIAPSTLNPGQVGSYNVTVFSSVPVTLSSSAFPHGWHYRKVGGSWDEYNCGGSRNASMSWKANPSIGLSVDSSQEPSDFTVFLEAASPALPLVVQEAAVGDGACSRSATPAPGESQEEDPDLVEFLRRHKAHLMEACVSVIEAKSPLYRELLTSGYTNGSFARLMVPGLNKPFLLLVSTRHAGQLGTFALHIFSHRPFVTDGVESLLAREREVHLQQYALENEKRQTLLSAAKTQQISFDGSEDVVVVRNEIIRQCMITGEKFVDRDFPRGGSSLFLDPDAKPPPTFPKETHWKRPTELMEKVVFLPDWKCDAPFPYSRREWFASVVHAIATKPLWLQNVAVGYNEGEGMAQFRFFKDGKWKVVTIDDYLLFDSTMDLCMGRPGKDSADIFFPLIEKAYAKAHRCYETLEPKVTPELGFLELVCQGLMDLSGCATINIPLIGSVRMPQEQQDVIWMEMKNAVKPNVLCSLLVRGDSNGASERRGRGILVDHIYPVLDARFLEGYRLVKLRHWGQPEEINLCSKWRSSSDKWTDTIRQTLEFREDDRETFWLSFDEVLYYFTNLLINEETSSVSWASGYFCDCPPGCNDRLLGSSQFSLQLGEFPPGLKKVNILLGLHQLDPRTTVLRDKGAVASYRTGVGLEVVGTADNTVWLTDFSKAEVLSRLEPCMKRDALCPLTVSLDSVGGNKLLTLVVFKEEMRAPHVPFLLSAWSETCKVNVVAVERNAAVTVCDEWPREFAIGGPSSPFWRDCPQYFIYPSDTTDINFSLKQELASGEIPKPIGFTVHDARACRSYLEYNPETVILSVATNASHKVEGTVRLLGMKARRGMPYIIVPFCTEAAPGGSFTLEAVANRFVKLCRINPQLDWCRVTKHASFMLSDGSVGGSLRFSSWRSSPQFAFTFPVGGKGRLLVSLSNDDAVDTRTEVGMTLLLGDRQWDEGKRRKLVVSQGDIIACSEENIGRSTLDCEIDVEPEQTLILVVYASLPYRGADVTFTAYSALPVEVEPVKEWEYVVMAQGSWELGYTAGGGAEEFGSWVNNPFVALNTFRRTQIVALLLQYPRGPEKPVVKRAGNKKAFLPPVIVNPNNRMEIAIDLNCQDENMTRIATTPYTRNSEVALVANVPAADSLPFVFVPHTKYPEGNGEYKLFVYADSLVELYPLEKKRVPYV